MLWSTLNLGGGFTCLSWWSRCSWYLLASTRWQWWKSVIFFCRISSCFLRSWCLRCRSWPSSASASVIPLAALACWRRRFSFSNVSNLSLRSASPANSWKLKNSWKINFVAVISVCCQVYFDLLCLRKRVGFFWNSITLVCLFCFNVTVCFTKLIARRHFCI